MHALHRMVLFLMTLKTQALYILCVCAVCGPVIADAALVIINVERWLLYQSNPIFRSFDR